MLWWSTLETCFLVGRTTPFSRRCCRVINRKNVKRYSMVIAWDPNFETLVDPAKVFRNRSRYSMNLYNAETMCCRDSMLPSAIERWRSQHERTTQTTHPLDQMVEFSLV